MLRSLRRFAKPECALVAIVPNADSLHRRVGVEMGIIKDRYELTEKDRALGHFRVYDLKSFGADLEEAVLVVEDTGGLLLKPLHEEELAKWPEDRIEAFYVLGADYPELCSELYARCRYGDAASA